MAKTDPERERTRLAEFYAGQWDGELEKVAGEAYELSDIARQVLQSEMERRGLTVELAQNAPVRVKKAPQPSNRPKQIAIEIAASAEEPVSSLESPNVEMTEAAGGLVAIRVFRDLPQALLAKGSLESAGLECMLADDNLIRMDWFYSNAIGGIKLLVHQEEAPEALRILSQPIPESLDVSGVGEYEQPKCPKCGSLDINFRELDPATYLSLGGSYWGVFVPIPIHRQAWSCHSCRAEWEDDGEPGSAESSS